MGNLIVFFFFKVNMSAMGFHFVLIYIYSDVCRSEHVPIKLTILST